MVCAWLRAGAALRAVRREKSDGFVRVVVLGAVRRWEVLIFVDFVGECDLLSEV